MLVAQLGVVLGQGHERLSRLVPLLGHLEEIGRAAVAVQGLVLLALPAEKKMKRTLIKKKRKSCEVI